MSNLFLHFHDVSFSYEGSAEIAIEEVRLTIPRGWTGLVGANGCGKTTLLRLAVGELQPTAGFVEGVWNGLYCPQRTDEPPADLEALLHAEDPEAHRLKGRLGLLPDWVGRWGTLSHGERKRAQIAVALWRDAEILAMDEPTNHVDRETRDWLRAALADYRGIGLLVSHDRELLDALCQRCIFIESSRATLRPGGYSQGASQRAIDQKTLLRERARADRALRSLENELVIRREQAAKGERQRSKRGIAKKDHDAKARVNAVRVADGSSGQRLRQLEGHLAHACSRKDGLVVSRQHSLGVRLPGQRTSRSRLLTLTEGEIPLGSSRCLWFPSLVIGPGERIGLVGPNGSGKSTLIQRIVASLTLPGEQIAYLPQEIDRLRSQEILKEFRELPHDRLGRAMSLVRRLGSDPGRLLQSDEPSPGEVRKLLLATCIESDPCLIVLDEPTNHLDLPSIECLEEALEGCEATLLLVSHDNRFLARLVQRLWRLQLKDSLGSSWILKDVDVDELKVFIPPDSLRS